MHSALYTFFQDQGNIVAGLLALLAGIVAYIGAWQAAKMQVRAVNEQTEILRRQNSELRTENLRRLARESLIAIRVFSGVLNKIDTDVRQLD